MALRIALVNDLIYPYSKGGVEKRVFDFANRLTERGHSVDVVGTKQWPGPARIENGRLAIQGVRSSTSTHNGRGRRSIWQAITCATAVSVRLLRGEYDVIDVQSMAPLTCLLTAVVGKLRRIPVVVTWHEVWGDYWTKYLGAIGVAGQLVERLVARLSDAHIAVSAHTEARLPKLGVKLAHLVPNGVVVRGETTPTVETRPGAIVCVSRLVHHKNIDLLVEATAELRRRGCDARVTIVGEGPERQRVESLIRLLDLREIEIRSDIDTEAQLLEVFRASTLFVLPSLREGFGLAVIEAAASGLPVVVVDHPDNAARDLAHPDLLVDDDMADLASVIESVLSDEGLHAKYSDYSRLLAERFAFGPIVDHLCQVYRSVQM